MSGIMIGCEGVGIWCDKDTSKKAVELEMKSSSGYVITTLLSPDAARILAMHLEDYGKKLGGKDPFNNF